MGFGGSSEGFVQGAIIFGAIVLFFMPVMISMFMPTEETEQYVSENVMDSVFESYYNFTGQNNKKEQPWALTGIYEPYLGGNYHYTDDGWLYGNLITRYTPTQYVGTDGQYTVVKGMNGTEDDKISVYTYTSDIPKIGHAKGDVYTYVVMDIEQQSEIFFTDQLKKTAGQGFYYEYTGYRYAFQPLEDGYTVYTDANGDRQVTKMSATTSSLSLIWYNFLSQSGISGQLIISGQDFGVAYLTAADIVRAFNSANNTARFEMSFDGVPMAIYIRIDPMMSQNYSVEECYNRGYWSIMVASISTGATTYYTADYAISPDKLWDTTVDLLTFNLDDYNINGTMKVVASLVFVMVLLSMLVAIGINHPTVLVIAGLAGLIVAGQEFFASVIDFFADVGEYLSSIGDIDISAPDWEDVKGTLFPWWK